MMNSRYARFRSHRSRRSPSTAEAVLWEVLRGRRLLGLKFRRQHPISEMIVDFAAPGIRLVVEVDGLAHESPQRRAADARRDHVLRSLGWSVMRFGAHQVINTPAEVEKALCEWVKHKVGGAT